MYLAPYSKQTHGKGSEPMASQSYQLFFFFFLFRQKRNEKSFPIFLWIKFFVLCGYVFAGEPLVQSVKVERETIVARTHVVYKLNVSDR